MLDTRNSKLLKPSHIIDIDPAAEFVTMATFREMTLVQEQLFESMFESVLSSVNT